MPSERPHPDGQPASRARPRSGTWLVVGLLLLGTVLGLFALFLRQAPDRPLPFNLWAPQPAHTPAPEPVE